MNFQTLPGLFISHGSPMLALDPEQVGPALHRLSNNLPKPQAIIVMSAHWESQALEVSTSTRAQTWHDFRGFPLNFMRSVILLRALQNLLRKY
jgi:4,5-DOPA dioxygenase extradiol